MAKISSVEKFFLIEDGPLRKSSPFTLGLYSVEKSSSAPTLLQEFTFYVAPQDISITKPGRMSVYQSLSGKAHVDHNGQGLATITLRGHTGYSPLLGPIGVIQFAFLRNIIDEYYKLCSEGKTKNIKLILDINFADYPGYGTYEIAVQSFSMERSSRMPLINSYELSAIALTENVKFKPTISAIQEGKYIDVQFNAKKAVEKLNAMMPFGKNARKYTVTKNDVSSNDTWATVSLTQLIEKQYGPLSSKVKADTDVIQLIIQSSNLTDPDNIHIGTVLNFPVWEAYPSLPTISPADGAR